MVEIRDRKELRAWLKDKPRDVAVAIAVRAALRVLPLLGRDTRETAPAAIVLPSCRAMAAAWVAGTWPTQAAEIRAAAAAAAAAAADAAYAAADAAYAAARAAAADAAYAAADAAYAAAYAAAAAVGINLWEEISSDASEIDRGSTATTVCLSGLWSGPVPEALLAEWHDLSARLLALDQDWQVWTDWYQDRLVGDGRRPLIQQLELDRVLKPAPEDWEQGPAHVNAILAELEREYRPPTDPELHAEQDQRGLRFINRGDRIDIDTAAGAEDVATDPAAAKLHADFRRALQDLRAAAEEQRGQGNWLGEAAEIARELLEGLGEAPTDVDAYTVVPATKRLEREYEAEEKKQHDPEMGGSPLSPDEYKALGNAIDAARGYVHTDPGLARLEGNFRSKAVDPPPAETGDAIVDKANETGAVTEEAGAAIRRVDDTTPPDATANVESKRNLVRAGLRIVLVGTLVVTRTQPVARWLIEAEESIVAEFDGHPRTQKWMRGVIAWVKRLPLSADKSDSPPPPPTRT